jgi:hypothetical protein
MVLRPIIAGAVSLTMGAGASATGTGPASADIFGATNNAYTAYSTGSSAFLIGSQMAAGTMSAANAAGTIFGNTAAVAYGDGLSALLATNGAYGTAAGTGSSMMAGAAQAGPYVLAAVGVLNALGAFRSNKIVGGGIAGTLGGGDLEAYALNRKGGSLLDGPTYTAISLGQTDQTKAINDAFLALRTGTAQMAKDLGLATAQIDAFTMSVGDVKVHPDIDKLGLVLDGLTDQQKLAKIEEVLQKSGNAMAELVLGAGATSQQLAQLYASVMQQRAGLELQLLQAQNNVTEIRTRERNAIDASNRALYDQLKALEDAKAAQEAYNQALSSAQSALASALSRVQSAQSGVDAVREQGTSAYLAALSEVASIQEQIAAETRQTANAYRDLAQQLREYVNGIVVPPSASFAQALTKALGGDREAMASLPGLVTSASEQARNQAANREEFAIAQARILSGVLEASAEAQRRGIETPAQAAQTLQQKLVESQGKLAEALSAANAIGAPLAARQDRLIDQYTKALSELATANSEAALARAQLALLVGNTAATATNTGNTAANTARTGALTQEIKALGTIIKVGGLVKFDPADPIRSVFDNISKTNTVLNAQFVKWIEITSGSLVTQNTKAGTISVSAITGFMTDTNRTGGAAGFPGQYVLAYDSTNYLMQIASNTATTSAILNNLAFGQYSMLVRGFGPGQSVPVSFPRDGQSTDYFATGAAFSNGIVTRPTSFNMGMMGEAGPEAIMPLANIGGSFGIRAQMPGTQYMLQALQTMQMLMQRLQTVGETTALTSQDLLSLLKRLTRDGRAMPVAPSVNDPLTVKVIS